MSTGIFINGVPFSIHTPEISYRDLLKLTDHDPFRILTVTYAAGPGKKPSGSLVYDRQVPVVEGMRFNVSLTNNA
jgi:hypothetical protein